MAAAKKKPPIQATDVVVGNRKLDAVLLDLAEQSKDNAARTARFEAIVAEAAQRSARAEELAQIALQTIAAVTTDLRALAQQAGDRIEALEKKAAAAE
jgi:hypothetical protein